MDKQITRNAEEQEAFDALTEVLNIPRDIMLNNAPLAEFIDHELLARGYTIVKIPSVTLDADGQCSCDHHGDHAGCEPSCHN